LAYTNSPREWGTVDILLISTLPKKAVSVEHPRKAKITKAKGRSQRKISSMIDDSTAKIKGLIYDNSLTQTQDQNKT
jgi:hypothetical protein